MIEKSKYAAMANDFHAAKNPAKEPRQSGSERRLVLPRRETLKSKALSMHLHSIHGNTDDAIHKGYCKSNARKLDTALARIITSAEAARELLRQNVDVEAQSPEKKL